VCVRKREAGRKMYSCAFAALVNDRQKKRAERKGKKSMHKATREGGGRMDSSLAVKRKKKAKRHR
jgi:hypothetical protein